MSVCRFCSAPMSLNHLYCEYCNNRIQVDLLGDTPYQNKGAVTDRCCPNCETTLTTIDLGLDTDNGSFYIERCDDCQGLFFDPGELELLLNNTVKNVEHVADDVIKQLQVENANVKNKVVYRKCPECGVMMCRKAFGYRSGVVVDRCIKHGIWLENSELRRLQEWKKAGGKLQQDRMSKGYMHQSSFDDSLPHAMRTSTLQKREKDMQERAQKETIYRGGEYRDSQNNKGGLLMELLDLFL